MEPSTMEPTLRWLVGRSASRMAGWLMHGAPVQLALGDPIPSAPFVVLAREHWDVSWEQERDAAGGDHRRELMHWASTEPLTPTPPDADAAFRVLRVPADDGWDGLWVVQGPASLTLWQQHGLWLFDGVRAEDRLAIDAQREVVLDDLGEAAFENVLNALSAALRQTGAVVLRSTARLSGEQVARLRDFAATAAASPPAGVGPRDRRSVRGLSPASRAGGTPAGKENRCKEAMSQGPSAPDASKVRRWPRSARSARARRCGSHVAP